jgi:flagellar biosynthesis protein FlhG
VAITGDHRSLEKSFLVSNLAVELARRNRRVRVVDADLSFPDQPFLLGLRPADSVAKLAAPEENGETLEIILQGPLGVKLLSLDIDFSRLMILPERARQRLLEGLMAFEADAQLMLVDTPANGGQNSRLIFQMAHQIVVMVPSDPLGMIDAYLVIKGILTLKPDAPLGMVTYKVRTVAEAQAIAQKMGQAVNEFLGFSISNLGYLYADLNIDKSISQRKPLILGTVRSRAAQCLAHITDKIWVGGKGSSAAAGGSFFAALHKALENGK